MLIWRILKDLIGLVACTFAALVAITDGNWELLGAIVRHDAIIMHIDADPDNIGCFKMRDNRGLFVLYTDGICFKKLEMKELR